MTMLVPESDGEPLLAGTLVFRIGEKAHATLLGTLQGIAGFDAPGLTVVSSPSAPIRIGLACGEKAGAGSCAFDMTSSFWSLGAGESGASAMARAARMPVRDKKRIMID
jgi:hypothetical protein